MAPEWLKSAFAGRKKSIKECLLDQQILAGIGNIYSDEILFLTGIRPDRPACRLTDTELSDLAVQIPIALSSAAGAVFFVQTVKSSCHHNSYGVT